MTVAIELSPGQAARLEAEARRLGVAVEALVRAAVVDLLGLPDAEFKAAASRILAAHHALYRRLD